MAQISTGQGANRVQDVSANNSPNPIRKDGKTQLGIVYNPTSSNKNSEIIVKKLIQELQEQGLSFELVESKKEFSAEAEQNFQEFLQRNDLIVFASGDGTLMNCLKYLQNTNKPFIMCPVGNESLFASYNKITADPKDLVRRIKTGKVVEQHIGLINNQPFYSMASIGLDSLTVADVAEARQHTQSGKASDTMYTKFGLINLITRFWNLDPKVRILVDGQELYSEATGYVLVSNTASYARSINPLPSANAYSAALQVGFHKTNFLGAVIRELCKGINMALHLQAGWLTKLLKPREVISQLEIEILSDRFPVQVDGELFLGRAMNRGEKIIIKPGGTVRVLI